MKQAERIAILRIDLFDAQRQKDQLMLANVDLSQEVERLKAENTRLRDALEKYADPANWACYGCVNDVLWNGYDDGPNIARASLAVIASTVKIATSRIARSSQ